MNDTYSQDYLQMQKELHKNPSYGVMSIHYAPLVRDLIKTSSALTLCDYGAGKQRLKQALDALGVQNFAYFPYDPAFPEYGNATRSEIVTCIDVLEHIEPEYVEIVIKQLYDLTERFALLTIHSGPAQKVLPDGRNAHLIQEQSGWWLRRISLWFDVIELKPVENGFWLLAKPRLNRTVAVS